MLISRISMLVVLSIATACSQPSEDTAPQPTNAPLTQEEAKATGAALPKMAIIKVPVGPDGKELNDQAEMRLVTSETKLTQANIEGTFSSAEAPQTVLDELDQTSSTESFRGWLGCGPGFRRSVFGRHANWNWRFFRPTYLNTGFNYGYNFGGVLGQGCNVGCGVPCIQPCGGGLGQQQPNFNYYYYNQGFNQSGFSGQGWNPGMSYNPNAPHQNIPPQGGGIDPYGQGQGGGYGPYQNGGFEQDPNAGYGQGQQPGF